MYISVLSGALMTNTPLPPGMPSLRERALYHQAHAVKMQTGMNHPSSYAHSNGVGAHPTPNNETAIHSEAASTVETDEVAPEKIDGSSIGIKQISLDVLMVNNVVQHSSSCR